MTAMDTTNPLASLPDDDLLAYRRVRDHVRGGRPLAELPDSDLLAYRRVRDAASGKAAQPAPIPDQTMRDLFGFTPGQGIAPSSSVPVDTGYSYPREDLGPTPQQVAQVVDPLVGLARSPLVLAQQVSGLGEAAGVELGDAHALALVFEGHPQPGRLGAGGGALGQHEDRVGDARRQGRAARMGCPG